MRCCLLSAGGDSNSPSGIVKTDLSAMGLCASVLSMMMAKANRYAPSAAERGGVAL